MTTQDDGHDDPIIRRRAQRAKNRTTLIIAGGVVGGLFLLCGCVVGVALLLRGFGGGEPRSADDVPRLREVTAGSGPTDLTGAKYKEMERAFADPNAGASDRYVGRRYTITGEVVYVWPGRREAAVEIGGGPTVSVTLRQDAGLVLVVGRKYTFVGKLTRFMVGGPMMGVGLKTGLEAFFEDATGTEL